MSLAPLSSSSYLILLEGVLSYNPLVRKARSQSFGHSLTQPPLFVATLINTAITPRTLIIGPCPRTLGLPLGVRSGVLLFSICLRELVFCFVFAPFLEEEILDYLAHGLC